MAACKATDWKQKPGNIGGEHATKCIFQNKKAVVCFRHRDLGNDRIEGTGSPASSKPLNQCGIAATLEKQHLNFLKRKTAEDSDGTTNIDNLKAIGLQTEVIELWYTNSLIPGEKLS